MTELVEQARAAVLAFFRGSPDEYVAIFSPAFRLLDERIRAAIVRRDGTALDFRRERDAPESTCR